MGLTSVIPPGPLSRSIHRLPQLDRVAFRIVNACKATHAWICRGVHFDRDSRCLELPRHFVQIGHTEIDHPLFRGVAKVTRLFRKGRKRCRSGLLIPHRISGAARCYRDTKVVLIPLRQCLRIARAKEHAADASDSSFGNWFGVDGCPRRPRKLPVAVSIQRRR